MRRAAAVLVGASALVAGLAGSATPARADADPASDVLLTTPLFPSYTPPSKALQAQIRGLAAAAKARGFPIRVALIVTPPDLGGISQLFRQPRRYARFLGEELHFGYPGTVLVAMPGGLGVHGGPLPSATAYAALRGLHVPYTIEPDALAQTAIVAMHRLARAGGHPLPASAPVATPGEPARGQGMSGILWVAVAGLGLLLAGLALAAVVLVRRRSSRREPT
jgi:hypothetical protein